jgi:PIN domain nuclease of toxin-antitoxin system
MRLLLDTHVAICMISQSDLVPDNIKTLIRQPSNEILISSVTIFEIAMKHSIGKKDAPPFGGQEALRNFEASGYGFLAVSPEHAAAVDLLPWHHKDPFDRLLVAQAKSEPVYLMTRDEHIKLYDCLMITF